MRTTFRSALLAAVAVAAALPAWAQTPAPRPAAPAAPAAGNAAGPAPRGGMAAAFDEMDANKDGRVSWDETWRFVQQRFSTADADRDGGLTRQEADALRPARRRPEGGTHGGTPGGGAASPDRAARHARFGDMMFRSVDANRDGRLTLDELRPVVEARFRGLDADADNSVARNELPQGRHGRRHSNGQGSQGQGQGQNQGSPNQAPAAPR